MTLSFSVVSQGVIATSLFIFIVKKLFDSKRPVSRLPLPPGPPPLPLLGNLLDFPREKPWLVYDEMRKKYGDVFYMNVLGQPMVFLGTAKHTYNLFEKRSSIYNDRAHLIMLNELIGWDFSFAFQQYGERWRTHRRVFHQHFHPLAVAKYRPVQLKEARAFLRRLLETPNNFLHHVRHTFSASIMSVAYGIQIQDTNDPYITTAQIAMDSLAKAGVAGSFLVDLIPLLRYIPAWAGAGFQKKAVEWGYVLETMVEKPFNAVKAAMKQGTAQPSLTTAMLETLSDSNDENIRKEAENLTKNCAAVMYVGGADTTVSTVQSFFLAMSSFPETQRRAQEELDAVVGPGRLPTFEDQASLPYVMAMVKETMRWQLVVPMAVPHAVTQDDEYEGYFIPKGCLVIGLAWSILHDPETYPEPEEFRPERFLKDGKLDPTVQDPNVAAFGFGRRICPGRHMSDNSLFISIASLLSVYNIAAPLDENGIPTKPAPPDMSSGMLSYPAPFECRITPRSEAALKLIQDSDLDLF